MGWFLAFVLITGAVGVLKVKKSCRLRGEDCSFDNIGDWLLRDQFSQLFAAGLVLLILYVGWVTYSVLIGRKID